MKRSGGACCEGRHSMSAQLNFAATLWDPARRQQPVSITTSTDVAPEK